MEQLTRPPRKLEKVTRPHRTLEQVTRPHRTLEQVTHPHRKLELVTHPPKKGRRRNNRQLLIDTESLDLSRINRNHILGLFAPQA